MARTLAILRASAFLKIWHTGMAERCHLLCGGHENVPLGLPCRWCHWPRAQLLEWRWACLSQGPLPIRDQACLGTIRHTLSWRTRYLCGQLRLKATPCDFAHLPGTAGQSDLQSHRRTLPILPGSLPDSLPTGTFPSNILAYLMSPWRLLLERPVPNLKDRSLYS